MEDENTPKRDHAYFVISPAPQDNLMGFEDVDEPSYIFQ